MMMLVRGKVRWLDESKKDERKSKGEREDKDIMAETRVWKTRARSAEKLTSGATNAFVSNGQGSRNFLTHWAKR